MGYYEEPTLWWKNWHFSFLDPRASSEDKQESIMKNDGHKTYQQHHEGGHEVNVDWETHPSNPVEVAAYMGWQEHDGQQYYCPIG